MANTENCPKVGIVMGSDSDMPVMAKAADILEELGIPYEMTVISAHREPDVFFEYAKSAEEKGFKVIIAAVWQRICPACVPLFSLCPSSESRCTPLPWEAEILCIPSFRCPLASRLPQ